MRLAQQGGRNDSRVVNGYYIWLCMDAELKKPYLAKRAPSISLRFSIVTQEFQ